MLTKNKWQSFKKILSVYLAVLMIVGMMPIASFANESVTVRLTIDGQTHRNVLLGEKFLDEAELTIPKGQTVKDLIVEYCKKNNVKYTLNGETYLSSLHELTEKEYGDLSGWTYYVWDKEKNKYILPSKGISDYPLNEDESIKFVYQIDNFWEGYQGAEKKAAEVSNALVQKIDKGNMSGYLAAALLNTGGDVPVAYKNTARAKVAGLSETSSLAQYHEVILAVLASGENPYAAWGRNLIAEVAQRDVLQASIDDLIYAIAIVKSGDFTLPEGTDWDVKKAQDALKAKQNPDGSFGTGTDLEKVILTAKVYNFAEFVFFSKEWNGLEDYLASQMHRGGGLPSEKEDYFATAETVLAMSNRSRDPNGRLSYRVEGNWNAGDKPSPYKALLDFYIESQNGFKRDYLDKNIDPSISEVGTLAMIRTNQYYNNKQYGGRSLFKFGKVEPPQNVDEFKLWVDKTYEEIVAREKAISDISEESGYILRRMGEEISAEQIKELEGKIQMSPAPFVAYKSVLAAIAAGNGKERENISGVIEQINKSSNSRYNSPTSAAWALIAAYGTNAALSSEKDAHIRSKLLGYTLFQKNKNINIADKHIHFAGAVTLIEDKAAQENYADNIEKLIQSKTKKELKDKPDYVPHLVTALNLLGKDITDSKYKSKDGISLQTLLKESDQTGTEFFFALASYKLYQQNGGNIFKYAFEPTLDERVAQTVTKYVDNANLNAYILKKYDARDITKTVEDTKEFLKSKDYVYDPKGNIKVWFDLMAGGENLQNIDEHNLLDNITKKEQLNQKTKNINSLIVLNSANYVIDPADPENRDTLKTKVVAIKEFKGNSSGKYLLSDAGKAMIALAPYYKAKDGEVVAAIDGFLKKVSEAMKNDGTISEIGNNIPLSLPYHSSDQASLVQGLIYLGIDPHTDERFVKNGKSVLDGLFSYETDNGFAMKHGSDAKEDSPYTRAALEALMDYQLFKQGKKLIYDYTDMEIPPLGQKFHTISFLITPDAAKDATLVVTEKDKTDAISSENGVYKLKAGDYNVKAEKSGYQTLTQSFTVTDEATTHIVNLVLKKSEETSFIFNKNTQTITGYKTKDVPQELEIPTHIDGVAVKHIGVEAFRYSDDLKYSKSNKPITKLILPEGLETIQKMAFQGNTFTEISIPASVREIHGGFRLCKSLATVHFAPNAQLETIGEDAFYESAIEDIRLPETVKMIGISAFHSGKLKTINLPEGLKEIKTSAFALTGVQEIILPSTVEKINFDRSNKQGSNGLFYRTFEDNEKKQLSFTRVKDLSGKATIENTRGVVNPVEVLIKYVDQTTGKEIEGMPAVKAVGINRKIVTDFGKYISDKPTITDGDNKLLLNYQNPYGDKEYKVYSKPEALKAIVGNYFTKDSEWIFDAPDIAGYNKPSSIQKALQNDKEEIVFEYTRNEQKFTLTLEGEGLTSEPKAGDLAANSEVLVTVLPPANKTFKQLLVNEKAVQAMQDGLIYKHSFKLTENTTVRVEYDDAAYDKEIQVQAKETNLKLGDKTNIKVQYRGQDIALTNKDIVVEFDPALLTLNENTGEVTAIGSGTVILSVRLKNEPSVKDEVSFDIKSVKVSLRIEDVDRTLLKPTEVLIDSLRVQKGVDYHSDILFETPVPFLAIKNALKAQGKDTSDESVLDCYPTGNWMKVIDSYEPTKKYDDTLTSFMYAVNNVMADKGVGEFTVKDGDEITIYVVQDFSESDGYVYFERGQYSAKAGEELTLKLLHRSFDMNTGESGSAKPFEGASLLDDTTLLKDQTGKEIISDKNGEFKVTFAKEGIYYISAQKVANGIHRISRPYAVVKVSDNAIPAPSITSVEKIQDIEVSKGTQRDELPLPKSIKATLSDASKIDLTLTWNDSTPGYDADKEGDYIFEASYDLPENVHGNKPEVSVKVTVKSSAAPIPPSLEELLVWAKSKQEAISNSYSSSEALNEWMIAEIGKLGKTINPKVLENLKAKILDDSGSIKLTGAGDLAKAVLALRAAGIDPEQYYGNNVVEALVNANAGSSVWTVGPKLSALSSDDYTTNTHEEIEKLIQIILDKQANDGLWTEFGLWADTTGSAIYALAPYYNRPEVKSAIEKAVAAISEKQSASGDLTAAPGNLNSLVMIAGGLWSCDPNYLTDTRLQKGGNTLLHAIKNYDIENTAGFLWKTNDTKPNPLATEQALRSLISLLGMRDSKGMVFDYKGTPKYAVEKDITVVDVDMIAGIVVPFGTKREDIPFPNNAILQLSDNTQKTVELTWGDSVPSYDGNKAGDYTFAADYDLPPGITGAKPPIKIKITVEDTLPIIESIQQIPGIEVRVGTEKVDAIAKLPKTTLVTDNKGKHYIVNLAWRIDGYNKEAEGEYPAIGTFDLPHGIEQSVPPTELEVKTIVKVAENESVNPVDKDLLQKFIQAIEDDLPAKEDYTEESYGLFEQALAAAKAALTDDNLSQDDINEVLLKLQDATSNLQRKVNKKVLQEQIALAKEKLENKEKYMPDGVQKLEAELAKAEEVLNDPSATQDKINEQAEMLRAAIAALTEKPGGGSGGGSTPSDISVYFTLKSIQRGGTAEQIWIDRTSYAIPYNSNVRYLFEKALSARGIEYRNPSGNYVESIKSPIDGDWFGQFSNGPNSGWMYTVNGRHPNLGLDQYRLSNWDEVIWHYTNDYTKEEGSSGWSGSSSSTNNAEDKKVETDIVDDKAPLGSPEEWKGFDDVPDSAWFAKSVNALAIKGLLKGTADNHYHPHQKITRAEFIAILARTEGADISDYEGMSFSDVKKGTWYYSSIAWASANNIAKGYGKEFKPNATITREEMAAMLMNYSRFSNKIKLESKLAEKPFSDQHEISAWAKESVLMMQRAAIIGGKENNRFAPKDSATRAETAEMIYRLVS